MRSAILCLMISSVLVGFVISEENDEELEAESVGQHLETLDFAEAEDLRSDEECIPRDSECTDNRDGCCRGRFFKDVCECFEAKGNETEETCTCQKKGLFGRVVAMPKKIIDRTSGFLHNIFG